MTCQVLVDAPNGSSVTARALLNSASSVSFVSERPSQSWSFPPSHQNTKISGVAGLSHNSPLQAVANFNISPVSDLTKRFSVTAVVPRVTCDLSLHPVLFNLKWTHLNDLPLADPDFGRPGRVDMLLVVFVEVLHQGRRIGPPNSPSAFEMKFDRVLAGRTCSTLPHMSCSHHSSCHYGHW